MRDERGRTQTRCPPHRGGVCRTHGGGVVCDGAKSSCAAKIVSSVEAGILGYYMFKDGNQFVSGDGIIKKGVENTIKAIGELARVGMCETDKEIIELMIRK